MAQLGLETSRKMALQTTARRMEGGPGHEHIAYLWWTGNAGEGSGVYTRDQMVAYVDQHGNQSVFCADRDPSKSSAWVHTNTNGRVRYVQTFADRRWTDNLLSLPER